MSRSALLMAAFASLAMILSVSAPVFAQNQTPEYTREQVDAAIQRGIDYLWSQWDEGTGLWKAYGNPPDPKTGKPNGHYYPTGPTAIALYALLESGVHPDDPRMVKALDAMAKTDDDMTYSLGLRCNAWLSAMKRSADRSKYYRLLRKDVKCVLDETNARMRNRQASKTYSGGYHYRCTKDGDNGWDNSCSQYGVLAAWAGVQGNIEVPSKYWKVVAKHWELTQGQDGGWCYSGTPTIPYNAKPPKGQKTPTRTMTSAGVASLFVCVDNLAGNEFVRCRGNDLMPKSLTKGLEWFDKNFENTLSNNSRIYYHLYGVERVGLASGYKYFGTADWYKLGLHEIMRRQSKGDGRWGQVYQTGYALLFLARGQHPVPISKLQYKGHWNNRPRDLAQFTRWMSRSFEKTFNWQTINLSVPPRDLLDAQYLYIAGDKAPEFSDTDLEKLRTFVYQGGTLVSVTECKGEFGRSMREVYKKLFPRYELTEVDSEHPVHTGSRQFKTGGHPKLFVISNGVRPLAFHTDEDLSKDWMLRNWNNSKRNFEIMANIVLYTSGKLDDLRKRGESYWPAAVSTSPAKTVRVARLRWGGNANPEPLALERLNRMLAKEEKVGLEFVTPEKTKDADIKLAAGAMDQGLISIKGLADSKAQIAFLTGTGKLTIPAADQSRLADWVRKGNLLIVDAAGGGNAFADSAQDMIKDMFPEDILDRLSVTSDLYRMEGKEIRHFLYRNMSSASASAAPRLRAISIDGKLAVLFSREDLTGAIVGTPSGVVEGYRPETAWEILRNAVLLRLKQGS